MERRLRLNLTLLAVACLLGLLVWQAQSPGMPPLTPLDPGEIESIVISDLAGRQVALHKREGVWLSGSAPADAGRIAQLLRICRTPSLDRFTPSGELTPFGLEPAPIRLRIDQLTLDFGATDPLNGWRYVRIGERIHLIADGFYHHLTAPPDAWLETR
jgi:hypothetical protein